MATQQSHTGLLVLLIVSLTSLILLVLFVVLYSRYRKRKDATKPKTDLKNDARDIVQTYNKRQEIKLQAANGQKIVMPELTEDNSHTSILNINKLLKMGDNGDMSRDVESNSFNRHQHTADTNVSYYSDYKEKSYMST